MNLHSSQAALEGLRRARARRRLTDELELAENVVAQIERKRRGAVQRIDNLGRLQRAMTHGERIAMQGVLKEKQQSLLHDLERLQTEAAVTTSFLILRNRELEQLLAG